MLIFKILAEKIGFCRHEKLFFGLYQFLVENFWSSPIFSGKTGLCGRGDLFCLYRFLVEKQDSMDVKIFFLVFTDFSWFHNKELLTF